tara:strand:+ start:146 stop:886 length:741 start_codon:yes stop_codon:yes gene_type:complete
MDGNYTPYDYLASFARIDEHLDCSAGDFTESAFLPDRQRLTFDNGFYAYCTALFVDIRDSSDLPNHYQRPRLARIYRAFVSEVVAILNGHISVREVNIVGDCVWAVYNTRTTDAIDDVFNLAAKVNLLENVLNRKLAENGYGTPLYLGVGLSYGMALMIKAGKRGSTINDVVYMGDVVNQAAHLAARGGKVIGWRRSPRIHMDLVFQQNLNELNRNLTTQVETYPREVYASDAVDTAMSQWLEAQS